MMGVVEMEDDRQEVGESHFLEPREVDGEEKPGGESRLSESDRRTS